MQACRCFLILPVDPLLTHWPCPSVSHDVRRRRRRRSSVGCWPQSSPAQAPPSCCYHHASLSPTPQPTLPSGASEKGRACRESENRSRVRKKTHPGLPLPPCLRQDSIPTFKVAFQGRGLRSTTALVLSMLYIVTVRLSLASLHFLVISNQFLDTDNL